MVRARFWYPTVTNESGGPQRRLCGWLVLVLWLSAPCTAVGAETATEELASRLAPIEHLEGEFTQTVVGARRELVQSSEGYVHIARPKQFKWVLFAPYPQTIVTVGDRVYVYDPDLQQIQVKPLEQALAGTPALVLLGTAKDIAAQFDVSRSQSDGLDRFDLVPKSADAVFTQISMTFDGPRLLRIEIVDSLGQVTEVDFRNLQINGPLAPNEFQFEIPPGTDVIGDAAAKPA